MFVEGVCEMLACLPSSHQLLGSVICQAPWSALGEAAANENQTLIAGAPAPETTAGLRPAAD